MSDLILKKTYKLKQLMYNNGSTVSQHFLSDINNDSYVLVMNIN